MPNTKPVGVAYSDPSLDSATVSGAVTAASVAATGAVTSATVTATGAVTGASLVNSTSSGAVASNGTGGFYMLSTAITANSTTTTAPAGSFGVTSNATGLGKLFYSDGTKWQFGAIT